MEFGLLKVFLEVIVIAMMMVIYLMETLNSILAGIIEAGFSIETLNFILGAIVALIIPLINLVWKKYKQRSELSKIKNMILKEYVNPVSNDVQGLKLNSKPYFKEQLKISNQRLDYLLKKEVSYMNSEIQFEVIRMIEYTKMYFVSAAHLLTYYTDYISVRPGRNDKRSEDEAYKKTGEKLTKLTNHYKETIDDYTELHRNHLIDEEDEDFFH